jgi:hypothetical protein
MNRFRLLLLAALLPWTVSAQLRLHPKNPHYFEFRGKPTLLITSAEHYGAVLNLDFEYLPYLDELAAHRLNYTRLFSGAYVENPGDFGIPFNTLAAKPNRLLVPWARSTTDGYHGGGAKFDLERWDEAYFTRLREFVREAGKRGIVVEMTLFSSHYSDRGWRNSPMHRLNTVSPIDSVSRNQVLTLHNGNLLGYQERLVRKLVRELTAFDNVLFELQNEPWADAGTKLEARLAHRDSTLLLGGAKSWPVEVGNPDRMAWQRQVAGWIADEEQKIGRRHLVAQNITNFRTKITDPDPRVSVFHFHYAHPEAVTLNDDLNRPIGFDESGFHGPGDDVYRRQAWRFILSGGALFNNLDYSFTIDHEAGTHVNEKAPGGGSRAFRQQLRVLLNFMNALDFVRMRPAPELLSGTGYLLAEPGRQYALYAEQGTEGLSLNVPAGRYRLTWVDVKSGTETVRSLRHRGGALALTGAPTSGEVAVRVVVEK